MRIISLALLTGSAYASFSSCSGAHQSTATPADTAALRRQVTALEQEARALARRDGCGSVSQCRTAPLGERACGGPRSYLVYCAATTDSGALYRKLEQLRVVEKQYNDAAGIVSTCEYRLAPSVTLEGGSCREAAPRAPGAAVPQE